MGLGNRMRIVFLCSSLEPGRDGVGDYTRRLAGELIRQKHAAGAVALNDSGVFESGESIQEGEGIDIPVLRLAARLPWPRRMAEAREWVRRFRPDWISVQFVCFGFDPRGLPFGLGRRLRTIVAGTAVHWMFHELWVGRERGHAWKYRLWGAMQRRVVLGIYRDLQPRIVHTSIEPYARTLRRHGIDAGLLPIFSNIAVGGSTGWMDREIAGLGISREERDRWLLLGIFGTIQRPWAPEGWLGPLLDRAAAVGRRVAVLGIGQLDPEGTERFCSLGEHGRLLAHHFGPRPAGQISEFLQAIDGGIATVEPSALGKSGAAAAMREHGVPLLLLRREGRAAPDAEPARVRREIDGFMNGLGRSHRPEPGVLLGETARTLVEKMDDNPMRRHGH
jgi:hypothetical protein